ncbi:interleukin-1 receptor type 2-like [Takifugu flavidus]|uniref:Ig-like domain-containing protein n=1 Tax=Takifugu flavidus TaxID=433684 RepID=A0A5C6P4Z9_9TELE|nr:interleukin-1 receptor type 2-like [Takifugu flavidus]TWW74864.1 hypothetical protein D4764_14G0008670 [Takifugu flavidus]
MKLSTVIEGVISLCLLLADGLPVLEDRVPEIIGSNRVQIKAPTGQQLFLYCEAFPNCAADQTLIYWLVDGSFPEDAASSGRIVEMEVIHLEEESILQRSLWLKNVTSEDLTSTFTCVVTNAAGKAQKRTTLTHKGSDSCGEKS